MKEVNLKKKRLMRLIYFWIIVAIFVIIVIALISRFIYKAKMINLFNNFSIEELEPTYIQETRRYIEEYRPQQGQEIGYTKYGSPYYKASISKYKDQIHYVINDVHIQFKDGDKVMKVTYPTGEESIQKMNEFGEIVETYNNYLEWDSKNFFAKVNYIVLSKLIKSEINGIPVYVVSFNNETWTFNAENYAPINFDDLNMRMSKSYDYVERLVFTEIFEKYYGKETYEKMEDRIANEIGDVSEDGIVVFGEAQKAEVEMVLNLITRNKVTDVEKETLKDWLRGIDPVQLNDEKLESRINSL